MSAFAAITSGEVGIVVSGSSSTTVAPFIGRFEYVTRPLSSTSL